MTKKNERAVIDRKRGLTRDRGQRATNRNIFRCHESPSTIATGITTCHRKRRKNTYRELWEPRMIRHLNKWLADAAADEKEFGYHKPPVSKAPYVERSFGENSTENNRTIVSLALYDGDKMLFACSGITLPSGPAGRRITRFVTSKELVTEFNLYRNKDDKLRVAVCLPNKKTVDGFLGLYDDYIAIVTSFDFLPDIRPVNFHCQAASESITASGRATSGQLMSIHLPQAEAYPSYDQLDRLVFFPSCTEAALGASLTNSKGDFLGMIHKCYQSEIWSLPAACLHRSLMHFGVLEKGDEDTDDAGCSSGGTRSRRPKYSLPKDVRSVVPSGFWRTINMIKSMGYPTPPPLMLELNGRLLNTFEDDFGEVSAWEGYELNVMCRSVEEFWHILPRKVLSNVSRRAVSVVSFKGEQMHFACTGLLISWHVCTRARVRTIMGMRVRMRTRSVILTSASLVRSRDDADEIDNNLRIEVFLPPHQKANGILELYHLDYNIAIISVEKNFLAARPENIFHKVQKPSKNVVAIGREAAEGLLLATMGEVTDKPRMFPSELNCGDLKLSTCKIKKVGIGGPLISSDDGSFVGMNFYDDTDKTPFLPRSKIVDVLKRIDLPPQRLDDRRSNCPVNMMDDPAAKKNRWPVPEPYWYHPLFDDDWDPIPPSHGWVRQ